MAVAAFKSSSRRGTQSSAPSNASSSSGRSSTRAPNPTRRSRSVSAFARGSSDISTEFLNKRDNPLFDETQSAKTVIETSTARGAARSAEPARRESGRALSRAESGRRTRSVSQCPVSRRHLNYSTSESEVECKEGNDLKLVGSNRKGDLVGRSENGVTDQVKDLHTWSSRHSVEVSDCFAATLSGLQTQTCDDEASTASSGFGSDEKTIKAVFEQMKSVHGDLSEASDIYETVRSEVRRAISEIQIELESAIQKRNVTAISVSNVADIPPDLVNPGAVELVLEIRKEYAKKHEESQQRARNLRAELAIEEHREQELDRILREVLPSPKTPIVQKSRTARKSSSFERRKMSKRLAEDAKAYFDECVSLSTFDSSDFSSQEDPSHNLVGPPTPSGSHVFLTEESGTRGQSMNIHYGISQSPAYNDSMGAFHGQVSSTTDSTETGSKPCFSFSQKPSETSAIQQDIQQYIKRFEKNVLKSSTVRSNYCEPLEYSFQSSTESLLIDRVLLKSRIDSGNLLLCSGGNKLLSKFYGTGI
ncbi:uncharacterized protein LOC114170719 [Vigna unguiculata]|uniref:uncharacterized protein LOC114170719 n=1 Tax=Vigna unguiculata TaxID=3917 RepID=UPI0010165E04|nr:uncharacterized protein LOC114170719 [Vigna unguiculata]